MPRCSDSTARPERADEKVWKDMIQRQKVKLDVSQHEHDMRDKRPAAIEEKEVCDTLDDGFTLPATKDEVMICWAEQMRDRAAPRAIRLRASELLARIMGLFDTKKKLDLDNLTDKQIEDEAREALAFADAEKVRKKKLDVKKKALLKKAKS